MRSAIKLVMALAAIASVVTVLLFVLTEEGDGPPLRDRPVAGPRPAPRSLSDPKVPVFSDRFVDDSGYELAMSYAGPVADRSDLGLCLEAAGGRADRGRVAIVAIIEKLREARPAPPDLPTRLVTLHMFMGLLYMYDARFEEADVWIGRAIEQAESRPDAVPWQFRSNLTALRGVASLRRGELENCVACLGPSSCLFPIAPEAVHQQKDGSRRAVAHFSAYLRERPDDLGARWLLNVAQMTLGEHPGGVAPEHLIPLNSLRAGAAGGLGRFENAAVTAGFSTRTPNMLGGAAFDDFDGDGRPDVMVVSGDWDLGGSLFVNRGDGTFEDRGNSAGLAGVKMAVNLTHADYDNDGDLDALALRGGWETPYPLTLLRNRGDGSFEDVTAAAGLGGPIATQAAAWADYDRDGLLDVYVAGEHHDLNATAANLGRLYRNKGDGTFTDVAAAAGVENGRWAKGLSWGDYDNDGDPDLYVSNMNGPNRLYRNNGDGTFTDVAPELKLTEPNASFTCWFWDYDNDGRLDLFVTGFNASLKEIVADATGEPGGGERPKLYRNLGPEGFREVSKETGLDRVLLPMGANVGDIDNDGYLDVYLGTGRPPYSVLVPNVMFRNAGGVRFEDVTVATGTGHLQKGHGVAFADHDGDGDLDLFVQVGGQTPGDKAHNAFFKNPGVPGRRWLSARLVGTKSNRSAIGAKVRAEFTTPEGEARTVYRVVGQGPSFGSSALPVWLGLGESTAVKSLTVTWPADGATQDFHDLQADRRIEIVEGANEVRELP